MRFQFVVLFLNKRLQFVFVPTPFLSAELEKQGLTGFLGSPQSVGMPGELSGAFQICSPTGVLL